MVKVCYPFVMYGEYEDGSDATVGGFDEEDCMGKLIGLIDKHGMLTYYTGISDEDYSAGECIGRDNFIYD